jgi:transporter family protein
MGLSNSKDSKGRMPRVSSTSAAFGRLRIDSPGATTPGSARSGMSIRRRQQQRMMAEGRGAVSGASPMIGTGYAATEQSPLILPAASRQLHHAASDSPDLLLESMGSPPIAVWIVPALCCAMAYALYNIFIKKGSSHINPVLGGVILQLVAACLGCCLLGFLVWKEGGAAVIDYDMEGIHWAILAGLAVGIAEIVSFFVSSLGVQAMQSIPIIIGGSVMFGTVLGAVALHEQLSYRGWLGVLLISLGISLVGLDSEGEE